MSLSLPGSEDGDKVGREQEGSSVARSCVLNFPDELIGARSQSRSEAGQVASIPGAGVIMQVSCSQFKLLEDNSQMCSLFLCVGK